MGLFKEVTNTVKSIFNADDDMMFDEEPEFQEEKKSNPLPKIKFGKNEAMSQVIPSFDANNHNFDASQNDQRKKNKSNGRIQVYVPKSFEEAFNIIKDVKNGFTAMVNVEVANPQISQRIIDLISGAIYALGGECKKMGDKQYIFSLSAETIGAYDYLPVNGVGNQGMSMQFSQGMGEMYGQMQQPSFGGGSMNFNQPPFNFGQQQGGSFGQSGMGNFGQSPIGGFGQQQTQSGFGKQMNFGQQPQQSQQQASGQDMKSFYVPPQSQF